MKKLLVSTLLAGTIATGALASGPTVPVEPPVAPPAPVAYNWSGAYAGAGLAYANASQSITAPVAVWPNATGGMASAFVGYNWQRGSMVYSAEIMGNLGNLLGTGPCVSFPGQTCTTSVENFVSVRGRVGVAHDRTLLFATAGIATDTRTYSRTPPLVSANQRFTGGVVGVGFERAVGAGSWTVRGDLEYYFYGSETFGGATVTPTATVARMSVVRRF